MPNEELASTLAEACGEAPSFICRQVYEWTDSADWAELIDIVFAKPLKILLILLLAWLIRRLLVRLVARFEKTLAGEHPPARRLKRRLRTTAMGQRLPERILATGQYSVRSAARAATLGVVLRSLTTFVVWTIACLTILGEIGINLGPLIAGAGIAGVALGFGAQSLVKDFLAGMFILIEDQYGVGDVLDAGDMAGTAVVGTVEAVSLRTTRVRGADGTVWHIPNGQILRVGNKSQQWQQALVQALVGPTADLDQAQEVIRGTAEAMRSEERWRRRIVADPELLGVESVTPEATTILISVRTLPEARYPVMRELRARVKAALDDAGVPPPVVPGVAAPAAKRRTTTPKS